MGLQVKKYHEHIYYYTGFEHVQEIEDAIKKIKNWLPRFDLVYTCNLKEELNSSVYDLLTNFIVECAKEFAKEKNFVVDEPTISTAFHADKQIPPHSIKTHTDTVDIENKYDEAYTLLVYLNSDYSGGEISFTIRPELHGHDKGGSPQINIKPDIHPAQQDNIDLWIKPESCSVLIMKSDTEVFHTAHQVNDKEKILIKHFVAGWKKQ